MEYKVKRIKIKKTKEDKEFICPECGIDLKEEGFYLDIDRGSRTDYIFNELSRRFEEGDYVENDNENGDHCKSCGEDITRYIEDNGIM